MLAQAVEILVHRYKRIGDVRSVQEKHGPDTKLSEQELIVLQLFLDKPGIYPKVSSAKTL